MDLETAKKSVFDKKPVFKNLYLENKDKKWIDYASENFILKNNHGLNGIEKLEAVLVKILSPLIGREKTEKTIKTIKETALVSTADHHGILCHPFFYNSSLLRSDSRILNKDQSVIAFTCGCISPTNSSYPRGIFFHNKNMDLNKLNFLSLKHRRRPLYGLPAISKEKVQKEKEKIHSLNLEKKQKNKLKKLLDLIIDNENIWKQKKFSNQLTIINDILWDFLFKSNRANLIYIEIESILREMIIADIDNKDSVIYQILFNEYLRTVYINNFENITGAHNTKEKKGSHIFWYIDEKENTRKQLWINGNNFISSDKKIIIPIEPEKIKESLIKYELMTSMAFCYSILAFEIGLTLGGGFSQIKYLGDMKESFEKVLEKIDLKIKKPRTDIFTGEFSVISIGNKERKDRASLIDLLLYADNPEELVLKCFEETSIEKSLDAMMDEFLEITTGKREGVEINYGETTIKI